MQMTNKINAYYHPRLALNFFMHFARHRLSQHYKSRRGGGSGGRGRGGLLLWLSAILIHPCQRESTPPVCVPTVSARLFRAGSIKDMTRRGGWHVGGSCCKYSQPMEFLKP